MAVVSCLVPVGWSVESPQNVAVDFPKLLTGTAIHFLSPDKGNNMCTSEMSGIPSFKFNLAHPKSDFDFI